MLTYSTIFFFFYRYNAFYYSYKIISSVVTPRSFKLVETITFLQNYAGNDDDVEISSDVDKKLRQRRNFTLLKKFDETTTMTTTNSDHYFLFTISSPSLSDGNRRLVISANARLGIGAIGGGPLACDGEKHKFIDYSESCA